MSDVATMDKADSTYSAENIQVLEGLEAVRVRPGMYIGSTGKEGLAHLLWETIDNSVDEAAEGHGNRISVVLHKDGSYEVSDNGRGIPVGEHSEGRSALEVIFCELHAGGKFGSSNYSASGGLHGVGASVVNALSTRVDVVVERNKKRHSLSFNRGVPGHFDGDKFTKSSKLKSSGRLPAKQTGTVVRYWPDGELLSTASEGIPASEIIERMRQTCYLIPGLRVQVSDLRGDAEEVIEVGPYDGLVQCVDDMGQKIDPDISWVAPPMLVEGSATYTETVPVDGEVREVERVCHVEAALRWTDRPSEGKIVTWVNTVPTPDGGTHLEGFSKGLVSAVRAVLKQADLKKLKKAETGVGQDDALAGLIAAVRVKVPEPQFRGQTKRQLGTVAVEQIALDTVKFEVNEWFERRNPGVAAAHTKAVLNWIADCILAREAAAKAAAAKRRSKKVEGGSLPAKLADCHVHNTDSKQSWAHPKPELLIVEGDSAAGPAKRSRDARWQAVLPLRGKIMNAGKSTRLAVLKNTEAAALITAIGAGTEKDFSLPDARYENIILLADADVDGSHIRCLVLTFLWHYMRPMLEAGRVYAAQPPTHVVVVGKDKEFVYSEAELAKLVSKHEKAKKDPIITRFKGLGEMEDEELQVTALDPNTRQLRRVAVHEAERAAVSFNVMMGNSLDERKRFISEHSSAYGADLDV